MGEENTPKRSRSRLRRAGLVPALGVVMGVWAFVGLPTPWAIFTDLTSAPKPRSNTEVILDASAMMNRRFDGRTKLDAAADAIAEYVQPFRHEGLGLRRTGGSCDESGELLVEPDANNNAKVTTVAAEQEARGSSNLAYAIIAAADEFSSDRFAPDSRNRIVVVTGTGRDDCLKNAAQAVSRELERNEIEVVVRLIAFGIAGEDMKEARQLKVALGEAPTLALEAPSAEFQQPPCGEPARECSEPDAAPERSQERREAPTETRSLTAVQFPRSQFELGLAVARERRLAAAELGSR